MPELSKKDVKGCATREETFPFNLTESTSPKANADGG
jgi:hypothetical protein